MIIKRIRFLDGGNPPVLGLPKETPPVVDPAAKVPEKPAEPAVTPAKAVEPAKPAEPAKAGETPAVAKVPEGEKKPGQPLEDDGKKFQEKFQTHYQDAMAFLDENYPGVRADIEAHRRGVTPPAETPAGTEPLPPKPGETPPAEATKVDLSDPNKFLETLVAANEKMLLKMRESDKAQSDATALNNEKIAVQKQMATFRQKSGVPGDIIDQALADVGQYGISFNRIGGFSGNLRAVMHRIQSLMHEKGFVNIQAQIAAREAEAIKNTVIAGQPPAAGPTPPVEKTANQKHLDELKKAGGVGLEELFDKPTT